MSRAAGLPVDGRRSTETVDDGKVGAAGLRGGVHLFRRRYRGRMNRRESSQIRSC